MRFFPLFLDLHDRQCIIIGGGDAAARKASSLLGSGIQCTFIAANCTDEVEKLINTGAARIERRDYQERDIRQADLIIAATGSDATNAAIAAVAKSAGIPVNVSGDPALSSMIIPSIIDRQPIRIALSSGGAAPAVARLAFQQLKLLLPATFNRVSDFLTNIRTQLPPDEGNSGARRQRWTRILRSPLVEKLFQGRTQACAADLVKTFAESARIHAQGEVFLVGAGPGDPELLTVRALRLIQHAEVVLYDRLVSDPIMALVSTQAERIYVGKQRANHALRQEEISHLLVTLAQQGKRVLRLKGGDPFIFGRGGEEIAMLAKHDIAFQIVPGITAASGCAAYAGIPLTHRDYAHSCIFVTGHLQDGADELNWASLVQPRQTLVVYMGLTGLAATCGNLILHGLDATTPAALVQQGTTSGQAVYVGTVANLPQLVAASDIQPPTLVIIGEVVKLREQLRWFETTQ